MVGAARALADRRTPGKLPQQGLGVIRTLELIVAEAEHLVSPELEVAVGGNHLRVLGGVRNLASVAGVVLGSVDLQDDALSVRQQQEKVHAGAQQRLRAALLDGLGVPVTPASIPSAFDPHIVERAWFRASRWSAPLYERP
ncbi:hypothetical protein ACWFRK_40175 [Streptomyces sp. NPDC055157]